MEILIFYIWVCNTKDIVFSVKIFLEFATLKLHIKLKKGHERQNKVHGIHNMHQCKTGHISRNK